jgi:Glyoxalase-like domain
MRDEGVEPNFDILIDCADPQALAQFWAAALGYCAVGFREPYFLLLPTRRTFPPAVLRRVPEPKWGNARTHFELRVTEVDAEVRRLEALGARRIDVGQGEDANFVPMADPEGNEFCVCPGAPLELCGSAPDGSGHAMSRETFERGAGL